MKKSFYILLVILSAAISATAGNIKCRINGTVSDTTDICKLVICRYDEDPKNALIRPTITDGKFTCEISVAEIDKYKIIDFGKIMQQGHTALWNEFLIEDGAIIDLSIENGKIAVKSTGAEHLNSEKMRRMESELFEPRFAELEGMPDSIQASAYEKINDEYQKWQLDYYAANPSIDFLFVLSSKLSSFHFTDSEVKPMLDIYNHNNLSTLYPQHSVHKKISDLARSGIQMIGSQYNDYPAFDLDGNIVKASDYIKAEAPTVIIMWATWCAPCRREALDMIPVYQHYAAKGVNFLGLAHEFKSTDAIKTAVDKDKHPWPTILDLDDKYSIFKNHGTSSSGIYLIDGSGKIVTTAYDFNEIKPELDKLIL